MNNKIGQTFLVPAASQSIHQHGAPRDAQIIYLSTLFHCLPGLLQFILFSILFLHKVTFRGSTFSPMACVACQLSFILARLDMLEQQQPGLEQLYSQAPFTSEMEQRFEWHRLTLRKWWRITQKCHNFLAVLFWLHSPRQPAVGEAPYNHLKLVR